MKPYSHFSFLFFGLDCKFVGILLAGIAAWIVSWLVCTAFKATRLNLKMDFMLHQMCLVNQVLVVRGSDAGILGTPIDSLRAPIFLSSTNQ